MPKISKSTIEFGPEDWLSGQNFQAVDGSLVVGNGIAYMTNFSPYRPAGIASPGFNVSNVTGYATINANDTLCIAGVSGGSGGNTKAYILTKGNGSTGGSSRVHEYDVVAGITSAGSFPHAITNAINGQDIINYNVGSTAYAFYSYSTSTVWGVGRYDFSATFVDSYMSGTAASPLAAPYTTGGVGEDHPMIVGDDDILYIGDRNYVHGFDGQQGANGTFQAARLILPFNYRVTSFAKTATHLVVFAYKKTRSDKNAYSEAKAIFWNYLDEDPSYVIDLGDNYVNGGFIWKGTVGCITQGRPYSLYSIASATAKQTKIQLFDGYRFQVVGVMDRAAPVHRGVTVYGDYIFWNSEGFTYSHDGELLYQLMGSATGSSSGMIMPVDLTHLVVSSGSTLELFGNGYANGNVKTVLAQPEFPSRKHGRIEAVEVELYSAGNSNAKALTLNIFGEGLGDTTIVSSTATFENNKMRYETDYTGGQLPVFNSLGVQLAWNVGPGTDTATPAQVRKVIVHYSQENIAK